MDQRVVYGSVISINSMESPMRERDSALNLFRPEKTKGMIRGEFTVAAMPFAPK